MRTEDVVRALSFVNDMAALGVIENDVKTRARYLDAVLAALAPAQPLEPKY